MLSEETTLGDYPVEAVMGDGEGGGRPRRRVGRLSFSQ